jgi:copper chaperone CopZ
VDENVSGRSVMRTETLGIDGMSCGHCTAMVKKSLEMVQGVSFADVQVGAATVSYDDMLATREDLEAAVTRFGYKGRDY